MTVAEVSCRADASGIGGDAYLFLRDSDFMFTDSVTGREKTEQSSSATPRRGSTWR
jgi:hypothetical protein